VLAPSLILALSLAARPVVVLDPGHGGDQHGASSPDGIQEKAFALSLATRLKAMLEKEAGVEARLTRSSDVKLKLADRVDWANQQKPVLFVSLHANSMPTRRGRESTQGIETYFLSAKVSGDRARTVAARENAEVGPVKKAGNDPLAHILADLQRTEAHQDSSRAAYAVHEALVADSGAQDRGVQQAPFYVLMGLEAPAILCEVGYISHPEEGTKLSLDAYQDLLAKAITRGVKDFLSSVQARDGKGR
jgi:N-acetylmuramoyl-L-alanine amidase